MSQPETTPQMSVVIPTRNESGFLESCVRSVLANDYPEDKFEVLVVDGMSNDGTRDLVHRISIDHPLVRLVDNPRKSATAGFNIGIEAARGELIIILSGHAVVAPDFLDKTEKLALVHPEAGRVGGVMETIGSGYAGEAVAAAMKSVLGLGSRKYSTKWGIHEGYVADTAFPAVHRWVYQKVGLFDESFARNSDADMSLRLKQADVKTCLSDDIRSQYFCRSNLWKLFRQQYQDGFWRIRNIQKAGRPGHVRQLAPLAFVIGWIVLIIGSCLFHPLAWILAGYGALYLFATIVFACKAAAQDGWELLPLIPFVFAAMHLGYGLGELKGIWSWMILRGKFVPRPEEHGITR